MHTHTIYGPAPSRKARHSSSRKTMARESRRTHAATQVHPLLYQTLCGLEIKPDFWAEGDDVTETTSLDTVTCERCKNRS